MRMMIVPRRRQAGFSMIETLITLVVISVGLLGLAKLQAASISYTQNTRVRSLIALQTESLAAAMHANKAFWAAGLAPATFTVSAATVTDASGTLNASVSGCSSACTPSQLAAYDVQTWASAMNAKFPSYSATVTCSTSVSVPVSCIATVSWNEKSVAINSMTSASGVTSSATQSFTLYIQP
ncbi:type IV pilus modification protein PilV [Ralstonia solanacearum]|uniref:Type IV fimbrial biogenesis protein PilV n=4 Tax=Ralstonia solanacearum species complex TaxID=3116862 RepID=A0A0S4WKI5_RALSL|nr:type IV pilus modification protein PilV [Ralstonia solanacearum]NKA03879.1 type IV pilus modification protein PilV [Ralstonia solanacearum]NKA54258.1 type IV pilus modification protein PilV [Ralstonia solanacearum]NKA67079.1 type IV pilus modification protein PilV [Ralstonia solanacearum]NKA80599.1 type IV pilus modification protein PilV [Ralstonia solanacearum]